MFLELASFPVSKNARVTQVWCHIAVITVPLSMRQESIHEFKASLGYMVT